jgi:tRNA1(Val) A37 N6-methylase TrmN6
MTVLAALTRDTLYKGQVTLTQPREGFRFGTDAVLLAAHTYPKSHDHILELGCGVGAAMCSLAWRAQRDGIECHVTGIEIQPDLYTLAQDNIDANHIVARAILGDITDLGLFHALGRFDQVICNPPYHPADKSSAARTMCKTIAHLEEKDGLENWLQAANRFLKPKGVFTMIHRADRLDEILPLMQKFLGGIDIIPIWPKEGEPAKRMLIRGIKGSRKPLSLMPGITLYDGFGEYTLQARHIIFGGNAAV